MSEREHPSLSGHWTGVYDYPEAYGEPVPFNAFLVEEAGALQGEIVEPNTFSPEPVAELFASLSGAREGVEVSFTKIYERAENAGHGIRYDGVVDDGLTRIIGVWRLVGGFPGWSGPFVMNRSDAGEAAAIERASEEVAPK